VHWLLNIDKVLFRPIAVKVNQTNVRRLVTTPTTNIQAQVIQVRFKTNFIQVLQFQAGAQLSAIQQESR